VRDGFGGGGTPPLLAAAAVIFGSGLATMPKDALVEAEVPYDELGWPVSQVPGHGNRLVVCRLRTGAERVLLLCGRPHVYEGWSDEQLRVPMDALAAWGVRRVLLTNACGALAADVAPGTAVVVDEVVDLVAAPHDDAPRLAATKADRAARCVAALTPYLAARVGRYVAVPGPQFETPAEVAWLSRLGDVVGMSTAPEVRAGAANGQSLCVLALAVNRAGAAVGHDHVLAAAGELNTALAAALPAILAAAWPRAFAGVG
jgi:purine-nucleoside phosphorylase